MTKSGKKVICYVSASAGDWGGASRVLFSNIRLLDRSRFEPVVLLPTAGPVVALLQHLGVAHVIWGRLHEPGGVVEYARNVFLAAKLLKEHRVDLLHINHSNYWRPAEVVAARLLRIPIVTHYHVVVDEPGPFVRLSSRIVAVSSFTADHSLPRSVPKVVVHNAVTLERFDSAVDIRGELGLSPEDIVVSFIGQVRAIKGIDLFLRMTREIDAGNVRFLIAGECRDPARFEGAYSEERLRAEIGNDPRVKYVGYRSDVENVYRASDIIVLPSRSAEPFGLINIEAGAAYRPIVASCAGGVPEIVQNGENGLLFDPGDGASLVRNVKRLVEDRQLREAMGTRARRAVENNFTTKPVRALEAVYDGLIRCHPGAEPSKVGDP